MGIMSNRELLSETMYKTLYVDTNTDENEINSDSATSQKYNRFYESIRSQASDKNQKLYSEQYATDNLFSDRVNISTQPNSKSNVFSKNPKKIRKNNVQKLNKPAQPIREKGNPNQVQLREKSNQSPQIKQGEQGRQGEQGDQ